jgi:hypothetical protein
MNIPKPNNIQNEDINRKTPFPTLSVLGILETNSFESQFFL